MLAELEETLATTRIVEARLRGDTKDEQLHGLCDFGRHTVYIDPAPSVVHTLIHELLHARWPSWSERRVVRESDRVFVAMDAATVDRWLRMYRRARRLSKRAVRLTDDD